MDRDRIIEKIKKLREHSVENGCNEAEAIQFALKAQKLIADNDVEEWELADEVGRVAETTTGSTSKAWAPSLALAIADNFRCKVYQHRVTARKYEFHFVGYKADSEAAEIVYTNLLEVCHRLAGEYQDFAYTDPDAYSNFVIGFVAGVRAELEKQCFELMIVCPKEVEDYFDGLGLRDSRRKGLRASNSDSISRGMQQGRDAVRSRRVEAPRGNLLPA